MKEKNERDGGRQEKKRYVQLLSQSGIGCASQRSVFFHGSVWVRKKGGTNTNACYSKTVPQAGQSRVSQNRQDKVNNLRQTASSIHVHVPPIFTSSKTKSKSKNNTKIQFRNAACLALCCQAPAKTNAVSQLPHDMARREWNRDLAGRVGHRGIICDITEGCLVKPQGITTKLLKTGKQNKRKERRKSASCGSVAVTPLYILHIPTLYFF